MGKGSKNVKSTNKSKQEVKTPQWVSDASKNTYNEYKAASAASNIFNPATGNQFVAGLTDDHERGFDEVRNRAFAADPYIEDARSILDPREFDRELNMSSFLSRNVDPETGKQVVSFAPYNAETMAEFQNPYEQQVINQAMSDMNREQEIDRIRIGDETAAADAFSGSGRYLQQTESDRNWIDRIGAMETNLRDQGFKNAQGQFNTERDAAMTGLGMETDARLSGAGAIAGLGELDQTLGLRGAGALMGIGDIQQQQEQDRINAAMAERDRQLANLQHQGSLLAGLPTNKTVTASGSQTTPEAKPDIFGQVLGATASLGGAAMTAGLFSDERLKHKRSKAEPQAEEALSAFKKLPVDNFEYTPEAQQGLGVPAGPRVGPMAQDFGKQFGGPQEGGIDIGNALGQVMLAIKALEARTRGGKATA